MSKHTKQYKSEEENPNLEDIPESVIELLALIGSAAKMFIEGAQIGALSGRHGDFIFSLVFDPSNQIDKEMYTSAIRDVIKKVDPEAIDFYLPSPLSETDENK
jgi:hypothetical protein